MERIASLVDRFPPTVLYGLGAAFLIYLITSSVAHWRRTKRKRQLKIEYDRIVQEQAGARQAEALPPAELVVPPGRNGIRSLNVSDRRRFATEWAALQASFVESPAAAVVAADSLLADVMQTRAYPIEDFPQLPDVVAAYHPHAAVTFRAAHALARGNRAQSANLEHLRQSFMHQRRLFEELLENGQQIDLTDSEPARKVPYHRWFREVDQK